MAAMNAVAPHLLPPGSTAGAGAGANGSTAGVPIAAPGSAVGHVVTVAANPTPGGGAMAHAARQQQQAPEVRRREPLHPHHLLPQQQKRQQQPQPQPQLQQRLQVPKLESTNGHHGLASAISGSTPAPPASAPAPTPVIAVAAVAAARSAAPAAATIALPTIQVTRHSSSPRGVKRPRESLSPQPRVHGVEGGASDLGSASAPSSVRGGAASTTSDTQQTVDTVDMDDGVSHAMVRAPVNLVSSCVQTIAEAMPDAILFGFMLVLLSSLPLLHSRQSGASRQLRCRL